MSYESPSHLSHPLALHGWAVGGTCRFLGFNWNLKAAGKAPFNKFCAICLVHVPLAAEGRFELSINCFHKTHILTRPGCTRNHGTMVTRQGGCLPSGACISVVQISLQPRAAWLLTAQIKSLAQWHTTVSGSHLAAALCSLSDAGLGGVGEAPPACLKVQSVAAQMTGDCSCDQLFCDLYN